jgi:hypothetical protein
LTTSIATDRRPTPSCSDGWTITSTAAIEPDKVHHPRACRAYAFQTSRGFVIVRIEDKTESDQQFNATMRSVTATFDQFLEEGERYE